MTIDSIPEMSVTDGSNLDIKGVSIAEGWPAANINNSIRALCSLIKEYLANNDTIASSGTIDLGASIGNYVQITGTTAITALGTVAAGTWKMVEFAGILTLTYNATSLILPGAANITTAAGDTAMFVSEGSGNWRLLAYTRASGLPLVNPATPTPPPYIIGMIPSAVSGTSTTAVVTISAGNGTDSTQAQVITTAGRSWAVSNGNAADGYQGGSTLPNSSTIYFFIMNGTSGTASFASTSQTPTLPSGYTIYRRCFSINTNSSGALLPGTANEYEGGSYEYVYTADVLVTNGAPPTTGTLISAVCPTGFPVRATINATYVGPNNTQVFALISSPASADTAPTLGGNYNMVSGNGSVQGFVSGQFTLLTNNSGQFRARCSAAGTGSSLTIYAIKFLDSRRF